jgi:hypothetical protein
MQEGQALDNRDRFAFPMCCKSEHFCRGGWFGFLPMRLLCVKQQTNRTGLDRPRLVRKINLMRQNTRFASICPKTRLDANGSISPTCFICTKSQQWNGIVLNTCKGGRHVKTCKATRMAFPATPICI